MCVKPSPRVLWSWWAILFCPLGLLTAAGIWLRPRLFYLFIPLWIGCGFFLWWRYRRLCYTLSDGHLCATHGIWITIRRMVPTRAVRQVTLWQGPVERRCRTAFLWIQSTGGCLLIEGIPLTDAEDWCRRLSADA